MNQAWRALDDHINAWIEGFFYILPNLVVGAVIALFFIGLSFLASRVLRSGLRRAGRHDLGHVLSSFAFWGVIFLGFLVVITVVLPSMRPADIFTSLGVGSVALGFAFKDILQNWLAGVFILIRRPFHRGDQIKVGDIEGTVQAVETRATLVKTYSGRLVIVPNTQIYTSAVTVHTAYDMRRSEIVVPVGMGVDLEAAAEIFRAAVLTVEHVLDDPPPDVLPWEFDSNNVNIRVRWWTKPQRSYEVRTRAAVVAAIKRASDEHDIDIPADTTISFAETPLFTTERKAPPAKKSTQPKAKPIPKSDAVPAEPAPSDQSDPEAETPKSGELNEGVEEVPR